MFCRSCSILPRYQNSHLFLRCHFGHLYHVRLSKWHCWADFPPMVYKDRSLTCHHHPPGQPHCQPHHPHRWAGEQIVDFLPAQPLWKPAVKSPQAREAGLSKLLPKSHPTPGWSRQESLLLSLMLRAHAVAPCEPPPAPGQVAAEMSTAGICPNPPGTPPSQVDVTQN